MPELPVPVKGVEAKKKYLAALEEEAMALEAIKADMPEGFEEAGLEAKLADVKDEIAGLKKDLGMTAGRRRGTRRRRVSKKRTGRRSFSPRS